MTEGLFLREVRAVAKEHPDIAYDEQLVDSMAALLVRDAARYDVVVTTNMFGDILSDEAAELSGSLGTAASINCRRPPLHGAGAARLGARHSRPEHGEPDLSYPLGGHAHRLARSQAPRRELVAAARVINTSIDAALQKPPRARSISAARSAPPRSPRSCARRLMHVQSADVARPESGREAATRAAFMKAAWRLVPFVTAGYLLNYMDRNNVGFAALTMNRDTGLTATEFGFGAGVLFFGYSFFEIPSNMALYRFGARRWIARIMITWGIVSAATAFVRGPESWYALRFLLGVAEAGFFPGITFYLATWFPAEYRARMLAWFLVAIPLSTVVGGPISGVILEMNGALGLPGGSGCSSSRDCPRRSWGSRRSGVLPDRPEDATFLTPDERQLVREKIASERRERETRQLLPALKDPRVLVLTVAQFGFTAGSYGVGIWLPQISEGRAVLEHHHRFPDRRVLHRRVGRDDRMGGLVDRTGHKIKNLTLACLVAAIGLVLAIVAAELLVVVALDHARARRHHVGARNLLDDPRRAS